MTTALLTAYCSACNRHIRPGPPAVNPHPLHWKGHATVCIRWGMEPNADKAGRKAS